MEPPHFKVDFSVLMNLLCQRAVAPLPAPRATFRQLLLLYPKVDLLRFRTRANQPRRQKQARLMKAWWTSLKYSLQCWHSCFTVSKANFGFLLPTTTIPSIFGAFYFEQLCFPFRFQLSSHAQPSYDFENSSSFRIASAMSMFWFQCHWAHSSTSSTVQIRYYTLSWIHPICRLCLKLLLRFLLLGSKKQLAPFSFKFRVALKSTEIEPNFSTLKI